MKLLIDYVVNWFLMKLLVVITCPMLSFSSHVTSRILLLGDSSIKCCVFFMSSKDMDDFLSPFTACGKGKEEPL